MWIYQSIIYSILQCVTSGVRFSSFGLFSSVGTVSSCSLNLSIRSSSTIAKFPTSFGQSHSCPWRFWGTVRSLIESGWQRQSWRRCSYEPLFPKLSDSQALFFRLRWTFLIFYLDIVGVFLIITKLTFDSEVSLSCLCPWLLNKQIFSPAQNLSKVSKLSEVATFLNFSYRPILI